MTAALTPQQAPGSQAMASVIEKALIQGDLTNLTPQERVQHYMNVCNSLGLNPLTKPFGYLQLNGKTVLYALRECTEQLRKNHGVSIQALDGKVVDDLYVVTATACDKLGRTDSSTGAVPISKLTGEAKANAIMKAETKAKRRVTLSICGLGMLDESEAGSVPMARVVDVDQAHAQHNLEGTAVEGAAVAEAGDGGAPAQGAAAPSSSGANGEWMPEFKLTPEMKKAARQHNWKHETRKSKTSGKSFVWYYVPLDWDDSEPSAEQAELPAQAPAPVATPASADEAPPSAMALMSLIQTASSKASLEAIWGKVVKAQNSLSQKDLLELGKTKRAKEAELAGGAQ